jgi:hypothetical protein
MSSCCHLLGFTVVLALTMLWGQPRPQSAAQDHGSKVTPAPPTNSGSAEDPSTPSDVKQGQEIPPRPGAISGATDAELQAQIQKALRSEPTLSGDEVTVLVSANTVELSGSVASGRDRLTAMRIARSYAGSKWVVNHLQVREPAATPEANSRDKVEQH